MTCTHKELAFATVICISVIPHTVRVESVCVCVSDVGPRPLLPAHYSLKVLHVCTQALVC